MNVAIITAGDELLSGDTANTNATWLCTQLTNCGSSVRRVIVVPDIVEEIANTIIDCQLKHDAIIITGGLGPTHDDVTLEGVAKAIDVLIEPHEDVINWFKNHSKYKDRKLSPGTLDLPKGSEMIPNDVGLAPGALISSTNGTPLYILPGVPSEMEAMFLHIKPHFKGIIKERVFIFTPTRESALVEHFEYLLNRFDIVIGSYPQKGGVKIRIEGADPTEVEKAISWLKGVITISE